MCEFCSPGRIEPEFPVDEKVFRAHKRELRAAGYVPTPDLAELKKRETKNEYPGPSYADAS